MIEALHKMFISNHFALIGIFHILLSEGIFTYSSQIEEKEESIWASALSCLLYFVCHRGKIRRSRLEGLDARVSHYLHFFCHLCNFISFN